MGLWGDAGARRGEAGQRISEPAHSRASPPNPSGSWDCPDTWKPRRLPMDGPRPNRKAIPLAVTIRTISRRGRGPVGTPAHPRSAGMERQTKAGRDEQRVREFRRRGPGGCRAGGPVLAQGSDGHPGAGRDHGGRPAQGTAHPHLRQRRLWQDALRHGVPRQGRHPVRRARRLHGLRGDRGGAHAEREVPRLRPRSSAGRSATSSSRRSARPSPRSSADARRGGARSSWSAATAPPCRSGWPRGIAPTTRGSPA